MSTVTNFEKSKHLVISKDQRRLNAMMGIDDDDWLVVTAGMEIPQKRMFETDEEKIKRLLVES